jgi:hypothetical protein
MILVAAFCVLFVTFMGVAWRQMASALYTFTSRSEQIQQDQGAYMVLAQAMRALEVGPPPSSSYVCYGSATVPAMANMRVQCPDPTSYSSETDAIAAYPDSPTVCYYEVTFALGGVKTYVVTVKRLSSAPTPTEEKPYLNMNDFAKNGPL